MNVTKPILLFFLLVPLLAFTISPIVGFANGDDGYANTEVVQQVPSAGITPESPLYFLDKLGEALQEFFTFNPEAKAHLQITFAAERIAEIKIILETKGVEAKGLDVAESRLLANIAKAATIVEDEKAKGKDVSALAKELGDEFESPKSTLAQAFKEQERALEAKEDELKTRMKATHRAGDTAATEALAQELGQVKAQLELLELKEEDLEDALELEEERIEEEMEAQHKAEKAIKEAREERQEVADEAVEEGVILPANAFTEFDGLLSQSQSAFQAENYQEARRLAKQAEKSLDDVEDMIDELEEILDNKKDAEEAIQEAEEERADVEADAREEGENNQ
ncbi:hypothetical protein IIB50_01805 [Patescibacteria group bacterium]|nr:hypothetical protein [Patescibacteria group bacterium]